MKVFVPTGCRSDAGLSAPIIKRLGCFAHTFELKTNFQDAYYDTETFLRYITPDIAIIVGDRVEMCGSSACLFHHHIPIAHVYAGVSNNIATVDDVNRHNITLWSDIQLCESSKAAQSVTQILSSIGKTPNVHVVGITHLDDVEISEAWVPKNTPYDLVLYNPITGYSKLKNIKIMDDDLNEIYKLINKRYLVYFIGPNPDVGSNHVIGCINKMQNKIQGNTKFIQNMQRAEFLGLLKSCYQFITNSSAAIYEAPHFLKTEQIIHIGDRNRDRDKGPFTTGASSKIVQVILKWYTDKNGKTDG